MINIGSKNTTTNVYRIQANNSIIFGNFWSKVIHFLLIRLNIKFIPIYYPPNQNKNSLFEQILKEWVVTDMSEENIGQKFKLRNIEETNKFISEKKPKRIDEWEAKKYLCKLKYICNSYLLWLQWLGNVFPFLLLLL